MSPFVVLVPEHREGHGIGHMARALRLASALQPRVAVYLPPEAVRSRREALTAFAASNGVAEFITGEIPRGDQSVLFVFDRRFVDREEVSALQRHGAVVAIDAGGPGREVCDYLIDILPRVDDARPNVGDIRFLELPRPSGLERDQKSESTPAAETPAAETTAAESPRAERRALVTFGGDDPAGMTAQTVRSILRTGEFAGERIDVLTMPLSKNTSRIGESLASKVNVMVGPIDLPAKLSGYTHVFTSFGLTAFEATAAGAEVILVNAGRYHERLSRRVGFRSAGVRSASARRIKRRLRHGGGSAAVRRLLDGSDAVSLSHTVYSLEVPSVRTCPACGGEQATVVGRFELRTYKRCGDCGMVYLELFEPPRSYTEDYFFEEYRAQYGRTYLEDAGHIKAMGLRRMDDIRAVAAQAGAEAATAAATAADSTRSASSSQTAYPARPRLLDIGCAYGPFLSAAAESGYEVSGIDPSGAAVSYVTERLGFWAYRATVDELADRASRPEELADGTFDVITMWYVIEHLTDVASALRIVGGLLKDGGVFAFSTPNIDGISGRSRFSEFLSDSPPDHFTLWSPRTARRVLERSGFELRRVRVTGHHPERFPVLAPRAGSGRGLWYRMLLWLSKAFGLGDTFEVCAVKTRRPRGPGNTAGAEAARSAQTT